MNNNFHTPKIMGILNITPDSFSDKGKTLDPEKAIERAQEMIDAGAEIIDIGGESTKPGAKAVSISTEISRIIPVIKELKKSTKIKVSVDTYKAETARMALASGADIINDIYALRHDKDMIEVLKDFPDAQIVLMHMQGDPQTMQKNPQYKNVVYDIMEFFYERIEFCTKNGIMESRIILDPGIGFGKTFEHNITLIKNIEVFKIFNLPILLGASRKSFINGIYTSDPEHRLAGSLATTVVASNKKIDIVRVHDVREHVALLKSLKRMY